MKTTTLQFYVCPHNSSIFPIRPTKQPTQNYGYRVVPYMGNLSRQVLSPDELWFTNRVLALKVLNQGLQDDHVGSVLQLFIYDPLTNNWYYDGNLAYKFQ